jgi:hypothetical protein
LFLERRPKQPKLVHRLGRTGSTIVCEPTDGVIRRRSRGELPRARDQGDRHAIATFEESGSGQQQVRTDPRRDVISVSHAELPKPPLVGEAQLPYSRSCE